MIAAQCQEFLVEGQSLQEQCFGEHQEVFDTDKQKLLIDMGFKALPPRTHPLEAKIAQHEDTQLGYHAIEYEGFINVFGENDALVAGLILHRRWNGVSIYSFFVEPTFRGIGLGKRLLNLAEELARQMGGTALVLETSTLHTWEFYLHNGFEIQSQMTGYIDGQTYFYMFKNLNIENEQTAASNDIESETSPYSENLSNG